LRAGLIHDVDALEQVIHGLAAHPRIGVAHAAEHVVVVLERVGVDRAQGDPEVRREVRQAGVVVDLVPGDVQGNPRSRSREAVHSRCVGDLLEGVTRHTGLREYFEARA